MSNQDNNDYSIAAPESTVRNYEKLNLQQQVRELESAIIGVEREGKANVKILNHLLKEEVRKGLKLNTELDIFKREQATVESELKSTKNKQQNAAVSIQRERASVNDLHKIAATDRQWLDAEMSRRSTLTKATKHKSEIELARMKRRMNWTTF